MDLFASSHAQKPPTSATPLAERLRPQTLDTFVGQHHLMDPGKPLRVLVEGGRIPSLILWGPPGTGKTSLARLMAQSLGAEFFQLNAVASGIREVREVIERASVNRTHHQLSTLLFIDEIHRFNKAQQDGLLHSVEDGVITLIGATTENPSFEVIAPLLSRCRVYVLEPLTTVDLGEILDRALADALLSPGHKISIDDRDTLFVLSGGDARMMLNGLETAVRLTRPADDGTLRIGRTAIEEAFQRKTARYDKAGEEHYNIISAFIKSMRGSDPDAAVYWLARMLDGGEDPKFIARRMIVLASEDIGNADPQALTLATSCFTAVDYVGMPEARIILAQGATYLASCPKSNASYVAISEAMEDVRTQQATPVPLHLRNAPTVLMKDLGYGSQYKYAHEFPGNFVEQQYLPEGMTGKVYYRPTENGAERSIRERLMSWWKAKRR
jgi:putative ATPase